MRNQILQDIQIKEMVRAVKSGKLNQTQAYAQHIQGRKHIKPSDAKNASVIMRTPPALRAIQDIREQYQELAQKGIAKQLELIDKNTTPPAVKNDIAKHWQVMAGHDPKLQQDNTEKHIHFHGLTDKQSQREIYEKALRELNSTVDKPVDTVDIPPLTIPPEATQA